MKTFATMMLAAMLLIVGCTKKQQALEEMQQPMSPEDLSRIKTQAVETTAQAQAAVPAAAAVPEATIVMPSGEKLEPLPPSGPYKPTTKDIQTALKNAGFYTGAIDGKIGPMSKKAIEDFQKANGLEADGKVGPKTWAELSKHLLSSASPVPETNQKQ